MKKVFVSLPMQGRTKEEIIQEQARLLAVVAKRIREKLSLVESFIEDADKLDPREIIEESLRRMARANLVVFAPGWEDTRGCRIEHQYASLCRIPVLYI